MPPQASAAAGRATPPAGKDQALLAPRRARGSHEGAFWRGFGRKSNTSVEGGVKHYFLRDLVGSNPSFGGVLGGVKHYWRRGSPVEVMKVLLQGHLAHKKPPSHKDR